MKHAKQKSFWYKTVHPLAAWGLIAVFFMFDVAIIKPEMFVGDMQGGVEGASTGFDSFGYNETARMFNGDADGVDRVLDGTVWGDAYYANDKLVMKWNAEWDRGNDESWALPPYDAWIDNEWNGKAKDASGETWHYKIVWTGPCGATGTPIDGGGYCIWGQFAVIMSQGTFGKEHIWDVLANPAGFGAYKTK